MPTASPTAMPTKPLRSSKSWSKSTPTTSLSQRWRRISRITLLRSPLSSIHSRMALPRIWWRRLSLGGTHLCRYLPTCRDASRVWIEWRGTKNSVADRFVFTCRNAQGSQPRIPFQKLNIFHGCDSVSMRWVTPRSANGQKREVASIVRSSSLRIWLLHLPPTPHGNGS